MIYGDLTSEEKTLSHRREARIGVLKSLKFEPIGNTGFYERGHFFTFIDGKGIYHFFTVWPPNRILGLPYRARLTGIREERLTQAGFIKDDQLKGVFRQTVEEFGKKLELTALLKDGEFHKLLIPVNDKIGQRIDENTEVIACIDVNEGHREIDVDGKAARVTLSSPYMSFDVVPEYSGRIVAGSPKIHQELKFDDFIVPKIDEVTEPSGFVIGGRNSSSLIKELQSINGQSVEDLEREMKPFHYSNSGFLGNDDHLIATLIADNDFVLSHHLTHQDLARQLFFVIKVLESISGSGEFTYRGRRFAARLTDWRGTQPSPFNDGTDTCSDITIKNLDNGEILNCSCLLPEMIARYGFYEGKGTRYRLDPATILKTFDFLKNAPDVQYLS